MLRNYIECQYIVKTIVRRMLHNSISRSSDKTLAIISHAQLNLLNICFKYYYSQKLFRQYVNLYVKCTLSLSAWFKFNIQLRKILICQIIYFTSDRSSLICKVSTQSYVAYIFLTHTTKMWIILNLYIM
jgi:hypothetical protein